MDMYYLEADLLRPELTTKNKFLAQEKWDIDTTLKKYKKKYFEKTGYCLPLIRS